MTKATKETKLYDSITNELVETVPAGGDLGYPADAPIKRKVSGKNREVNEVFRYETTDLGQTVHRYFWYV
jgi:hypothetical protein